jgi:hypothetical protein
MNNLSKQNFWDELYAKYPQAVELFYKWIDKYKVEIGWDELFYNKFVDDENGITDRRIKFNDLPFEMQNGILARFDIECLHGIQTGLGKARYEKNRPHYVQGFVNLFADLQQQLNKQNQ